MSERDGGPAFPTLEYLPGQLETDSLRLGITMRDYFAAAALTGLLAGQHIWDVRNPERVALPQTIANDAYLYADEMLAARAHGDKTSEATQSELRG